MNNSLSLISQPALAPEPTDFILNNKCSVDGHVYQILNAADKVGSTTKGLYKLSKLVSLLTQLPALFRGSIERGLVASNINAVANDLNGIISPLDAITVASWFAAGEATKCAKDGELKNSACKTMKMFLLFVGKSTEGLIWVGKKKLVDLGHFAKGAGAASLKLFKDRIIVSACVLSILDSVCQMGKEKVIFARKHALNFLEETGKITLIIGWACCSSPSFVSVTLLTGVGLVTVCAGLGKVLMDEQIISADFIG